MTRANPAKTTESLSRNVAGSIGSAIFLGALLGMVVAVLLLAVITWNTNYRPDLLGVGGLWVACWAVCSIVLFAIFIGDSVSRIGRPTPRPRTGLRVEK